MPFTSASCLGQSVVASPDFTPTLKGLYSYWSYEHLFELSGAVGGNVIISSGTALVAGIDTDIATLPVTAIRLTQMKVSRPPTAGRLLLDIEISHFATGGLIRAGFSYSATSIVS